MADVTDPDTPSVTRAPETSDFEGFAARRRGKSKRWLFAVKAAASAALILYVLSHADLDAVWGALRGVDLRWLIPAVAAQFIGPALITTRWQGLLHARGPAVSRNGRCESSILRPAERIARRTTAAAPARTAQQLRAQPRAVRCRSSAGSRPSAFPVRSRS